jgi:hypothetical protein
MRIKITRSVGIKGECFEVGASVDVDDDTAHQLIAMGRAVKHTGGGNHEQKHQKKGKS